MEEYIGILPYIVLGMSTVMPKEDGIGRLNIYQKADRLLEDYEKIAALATGEAGHAENAGRQTVVYSTQGGSGKTTIAYLLAVQCAKKQKTVYWNLEPLPVVEGLYRQEFPTSMEQLLFAQKSNSGLQEVLYDALLQNDDGVYVLPEVKSMGDYRDLEAETINDICAEMYSMGMTRIILDLPSGLGRFTEVLLERCDHIVWVFTGTAAGRRKEEKVRQDPFLRTMLGKSSIVRNCCAQKADAAGATAAFPLSGTLKNANHIAAVLEGNPEFASGCQAIMAAMK